VETRNKTDMLTDNGHQRETTDLLL